MRDFFNEDCMEGMKRYPDKFFNLAIVDPPYGIDVCSHSVNTKIGGADRSVATQIGGGSASIPKSIGRLMMLTRQAPNTLKN